MSEFLATDNEVVEFPGAPKNPYRRVPKIRMGDGPECPNCGGVGFRWNGWFTCDNKCRAIGWLETGEVFVPRMARTPC